MFAGLRDGLRRIREGSLPSADSDRGGFGSKSAPLGAAIVVVVVDIMQNGRVLDDRSDGLEADAQ